MIQQVKHEVLYWAYRLRIIRYCHVHDATEWFWRRKHRCAYCHFYDCADL